MQLAIPGLDGLEKRIDGRLDALRDQMSQIVTNIDQLRAQQNTLLAEQNTLLAEIRDALTAAPAPARNGSRRHVRVGA